MSYDEVTSKAFAPFAKLGDSVGNFVQNIPSYLPTPHPGFAAFNPATYSAMGTVMNKDVEQTVTDRKKSMTEMIDGTSNRVSGSLEKLDGTVQQNNEALKSFKNINLTSPSERDGLKKVFKDASD